MTSYDDTIVVTTADKILLYKWLGMASKSASGEVKEAALIESIPFGAEMQSSIAFGNGLAVLCTNGEIHVRYSKQFQLVNTKAKGTLSVCSDGFAFNTQRGVTEVSLMYDKMILIKKPRND